MTRVAEIETRGVGKDFGSFRALDDVSLTAGDGAFLTLLGPSGSGKTTFLMILAGFEKPSRGQVLFNGVDFAGTPVEERGFGMVFQGYALFPHMSVRDNIAFPLKVQRRSSSEVRSRTDGMIDLMGLAEHAHKRPSGLSGGQQQRVALARALAYEPPLLLLDEPFSALDKNLRGQMRDEVRRIHRDLGTTFVFVTHDQSEALSLSSRIAIFNRGQLQQVGTPEETYERPANRFVAEFLGDINILPVKAEGDVAHFEGQMFRLPTGARPQQVENIAIRPQYLRVGTAPREGANNIQATVSDLVYEGASVRLQLRTRSGQDVALDLPAHQVTEAFTPGSEIWASWSADHSIII